MKKNDKLKELILEHLRKTPILQIACDRAGVSRSSVHRWRKEDPAFAKAVDEAIAEGTALINDAAESQVIAGIKNGHPTFTIFWLKNKHPDYRQRALESAFAIARGEDDALLVEVFGEFKPETKKLIDAYLPKPGDESHG
ncbi:MAG: hypothetical protein KGI78_00375 [Patescibacteria group bacterium]|nr:hypothetical protein [Patescibacteria group bacterium]MDE1944848.1 hypothetical protein [Patescibacteria group bacterium]MDE2057294.1 hypothetical protein [Patescibacteria group bacterium]